MKRACDVELGKGEKDDAELVTEEKMLQRLGTERGKDIIIGKGERGGCKNSDGVKDETDLGKAQR